MRIGLLLVCTMLSVELSIGWLNIRCAHARAHIVSLIGAWVPLSTVLSCCGCLCHHRVCCVHL
jgi:hypothetical protein